jgi:hypothetical protein
VPHKRLHASRVPLLDCARAQVTLCEFRVLPQQFALERVALLTSHRRNVKRIIPSGHTLDRLLRPAMNPQDPGICGPVRAVRVIRPNPGEVGSDDLVGVFLELASQFVAERLTEGLRLRPSDSPMRVPIGLMLRGGTGRPVPAKSM